MTSFDANTLMKTMQDAMTNAQTAVEGMMKASTDASKLNYDKAVAAAQENLTKASGQLQKSIEDFVAYQKDAYSAYTSSGNMLAKSAEETSKRTVAFSRAQLDASVAHSKSLMACRTLNDVMDMQAQFARTTYDNLVAEVSALQALNTKVANEAVAPFQAQMKQTATKVAKAA